MVTVSAMPKEHVSSIKVTRFPRSAITEEDARAALPLAERGLSAMLIQANATMETGNAMPQNGDVRILRRRRVAQDWRGGEEGWEERRKSSCFAGFVYSVERSREEVIGGNAWFSKEIEILRKACRAQARVQEVCVCLR